MISNHRFAIHGMHGEHFGIAPAELCRGGCITFLADGGGSTEIVRHDDRLIFSNVPDAVTKIERVLKDPALQQSLSLRVREFGAAFSEERFMNEIRETVAAFPG